MTGQSTQAELVLLVPIEKLLFATHDMDWKHVERWRGEQRRPPVLVEELPDGWFFVHDGRHRATAAYEDGASFVYCKHV